MFIGKSGNQESDEKLIERFKLQDDSQSLAELFTRYSTLVYGVCLKYLKDRDDAKDAVMQIFEKLNTSLKVHHIDYFKSWLYTTVKNHCLMQLRAQKKVFKQEIDPNFVESDMILHHDIDQGKEHDLTKLELCIEKLNNGQRECVRLFYLEEKCYKDIVNSTGITLNKVKSHIQNGKRNLKICLEQSE